MNQIEYSGHRLTKISGVSARTLRYYDAIGLLKPKCVAESGYRLYGEDELNLLQQILFYKELGFPLSAIKKMLYAPDFDRSAAFQSHLSNLQQKRAQLDALIQTVTKSMAAMRGEIQMTDQEKFEGFKQSLINENERQYGREIREKYGEDTVSESNAKLKGMTQAQYDEGEKLRLQFEAALKAAFESGDPAGPLAQKACELHRRWLSFYTPSYSKEYHKGLAELYVADERFRANYDKLAPGCTEFLRDAIFIYCLE